MLERITAEDVGPIVVDRKLYSNGYMVLIARDCPEEIAHEIHTKTEQFGTEWFIKAKADKDRVPSTRDIFFTNAIVLKKNWPRKSEDDLDLAYFSNSVIHEMRTSLALEKVLQDCYPNGIDRNINEISDHIDLKVQRPFGAIINTNNLAEKYKVFECVRGISFRNEIHSYGIWNDAPEYLRRFVGKAQVIASDIAKNLLDRGIEPVDLGVHQMLYFVEQDRTIITVLDTEEYAFDYAVRFDPKNFNGLSPVLLYMSLGF